MEQHSRRRNSPPPAPPSTPALSVSDLPPTTPPPSTDVSRSRRHNPGTSTYYIIPGGMRVIFRDEAGNEITRCVLSISRNLARLMSAFSVGDFTPGGEKKRAAPIIVQDEDGKILYRHGRSCCVQHIRLTTHRSPDPPPETPSDTDSDSTCPHCRHHCRHRRAASPHQ